MQDDTYENIIDQAVEILKQDMQFHKQFKGTLSSEYISRVFESALNLVLKN